MRVLFVVAILDLTASVHAQIVSAAADILSPGDEGYAGIPPAELTALRVAYFASPPMTSGSPSVDGYIARIAVDVSAVVPSDDYANWFAGALTSAPPGALIVLRSEPIAETAGTVFATYDNPTLRGPNWGLWFVPEPATHVLSLLALVAACRAARRTR